MKRLTNFSATLAAVLLLPLCAVAATPAAATGSDRQSALKQVHEAPLPDALQRFEARKTAPETQLNARSQSCKPFTDDNAVWHVGEITPQTVRTSATRNATPQTVAGWYLEHDSVMTNSGGAMRNYTAQMAVWSGTQGNVQIVRMSGVPFTNCYATVSGSTIKIPAGNYCPVSNSSGASTLALVCPLNTDKMTYDPKGTITGTIADDGTITLTSWGIFVVDSTGNSASVVQANYATVMDKANGVMSGMTVPSKGDPQLMQWPVRINQTNSNRLVVENFGNTGLDAFVNVSYTGRLEVAPQYMGSSLQYASLSCMRMKPNHSGFTDTIMTAQVGTTNVINLPDWGIFADSDPGKFVFRLTDAKLTVDGFNLTLPQKFPANFSGAGTEASPYLIKSYTDLMALQQQVREENPAKGLYYRLDADIDCAGQNYYFTPIGFISENDDYALFGAKVPGTPFTGHFDGNGHVIKGIDYECGHQAGTGVFGWIAPGASVSNLTVSGSTFYSEGVSTGAIVGYNEGEVINCQSLGNNVLFTQYSGGGVAGCSTGLLQGCVSTSVLRGYGSMGSIGGTVTGPVRNCDGRGSVTHYGASNSLYDYTGGLIGAFNGSWSREGYPAIADKNICAAVVSDRATGSTAGGFIGSTVSNSANGNVIVSNNLCMTTIASNATSVQTGPSEYTNGYVGGFIGSWWRATLTNNVVTGLVMAPASTEPKYSGAVFGYIMSDSKNKADGLISTCQIITSNKTPNAALAIYSGMSSSYLKYLTNVFYDKQITGLDYTANSFTGALTTAEMTAGTALGTMSTDSWVFTKDLYPMLKELNTTAAMQIAAAPVFLQNGENMTMVKANFPLSTLNGVKWGILGENGLTTQGVGIDIVGSNAVLKNEFARDILCAYRDDSPYLREVVINTIPSKMWNGSGTAEDPYQIKNVNDLKNLQDATTSQGLTYENTYFKVMNDINVDGDLGFEGIASDGNTKHEFSGTFDGGGHTIDGVILDKSGYKDDGTATSTGSMSYSGFIGRLNAKGVIKNLTLGANCRMTFWANSGGISGYVAGRIENCVFLGTVRGMSSNIGGIAGQIQRTTGVVSGCRNDGRILSGGNYPGGIAGYNYNIIANCINNGPVVGDSINPAHKAISAGNNAGGIVGNLNGGKVLYCVNQGSVSSSRVCGGIYGYNSGAVNVISCLNTGTVNGGKGYATGAIGGDKPGSTGVLENNYYDGQLLTAGAVANGSYAGCTPLETAALTNGKPIAGLTDSLYDYTAGMYPVLKAYKDLASTKALRNIYMTLPAGMNTGDITADAALHAYNGLTWTMGEGSAAIYSVSGSTLKVAAPTEKVVQHGTVNAALGTFTRSFNLTTIPDMFDGKGTAENPYLIRTKADMLKLADLTNVDGIICSGKHFLLCNDIDYANDTAYVQIGRVNPFGGIFNGNGKSILNLSVRHISDMALFGTLKEGGSLSNLTLKGGTFTAPSSGRAAGFVNKSEGTVSNCVNYNTMDCGPTTKGSYAAGVVYEILGNGVVENCVNYGHLLSRQGNTGGIVGVGSKGSTITDCQNHGQITCSSTQWGGIVGKTSGKVLNCLNDVDLAGGAQLGGIAGYTSDTTRIENCINRGSIGYTGSSSGYMGGIIGRSYGYTYVSNCTNYGKVDVKTTGTMAYAGGIVGDGEKIFMRGCVNYADVEGLNGQYVGGIAGYMYMTGTGFVGYMDSCYNYGNVSSGHKYIGGVTGYQRGDYVNTDCGNYGTVTGTGSKANSDNTGGYTGYSYGDFYNCFNVGNVEAKGVLTSGFLGEGSGNIIKNCFNAGTVTSTATSGASATKPSASGFWATGRCDTLANCYNLGAVKGYNFVSGFIGNFNNTNIINDCYVSAPLYMSTDGGSSAAFMLAVNPSNSSYSNNFWDETLMQPTGGNTEAAKGMATRQMLNWAPNDAFLATPACYPTLKSQQHNAAGNFFAAQIAFKTDEESLQNVKHHLTIGLLEGVAWTCSPELKIEGDYVSLLKKDGLGIPAWLEKKADVMNLTQRYNLTLNDNTGVDQIDGKEVKERVYYSTNGLLLLNPAPGQMVIVKTIYTDGTATVERKLMR